MYAGSPAGFPVAPSAIVSMSGIGGFVGGGDFNGDGYGDVILNAPQGTAVAIFHGSAAGLPMSASQVVSGANVYTLALLGDVNGDGFSDFAVGNPNSACVVYEGAATISQSPAFIDTGVNAYVLW